jgi:hypothetical protein
VHTTPAGRAACCPPRDTGAVMLSSIRCAQPARGHMVSQRGLQFTEAHPGQCNCEASSQVVTEHRSWLRDVRAIARDDSWSTFLLRSYFAELYEDRSLTLAQVDPTQMSFYWSAVPMFDHPLVVWWACLHCPFNADVFWAPYQDATLDPCSAPEAPPFPGFFVHRPFAVSTQLTGVPDHHWVEVMRIARLDEKPDEVDRCMRGQVWFWLAVGSGTQTERTRIGPAQLSAGSRISPVRYLVECR